MSSIKWEEPPKRAGGRWGAWGDEADALRKRPGKWARISESRNVRSGYALSHNIRWGRLKAFSPAGTFEAVSKGPVVWARYVGPAKGDRA